MSENTEAMSEVAARAAAEEHDDLKLKEVISQLKVRPLLRVGLESAAPLLTVIVDICEHRQHHVYLLLFSSSRTPFSFS